MNMKKRLRVVGCIIRSEEKILLLYRSATETDPSLWGVPAGKVEEGETDTQAAIREINEETSIKLDEQSLEYLGFLPIEYDTLIVDFPMFVVNFEKEPVVKLSPREHIDFQWLEPSKVLELPDLMKDVDTIIQEFCIKKLGMTQ